MTDKLEMPIEQFAEAVAKENARLNNRIEKLEAALREIAEQAEDDFASANDMGWTARKALEGTPDMSVYKEGYRAVEEAMGHPSPEFWVERKYEY